MTSDRNQDAPYTAEDLAFDLRLHVKRTEALERAIVAIAFEGKPLSAVGGLTGLLDLHRNFEGTIEGFRTGGCIALTGREPPRGSAPALVAAFREIAERISGRDRVLGTDDTGAAERRPIAGQCERGDQILANSPAAA